MSTAIEVNLISTVVPLHLLPDDQLQDMWVSESSRWTDDIWQFEPTTAGTRRGVGKVEWNIELPDRSKLTDLQWTDLLDACKRVFYSCLKDPPRGSKNLKIESLPQLKRILWFFVRWMVEADYRSFAEIDAFACDDFLQYLAEHKARSDNDEGLNVESLGPYIKIPICIYEQREKLSRVGIVSLPEVPFQGKSAATVARQLTSKVASAIPPVPDEIFLPITARVIEWLDIPAKDIIKLQRVTLEARGKQSNSLLRSGERLRQLAQRQAIESFQFSSLPGSASPWHPPIEARSTKNLEDSRLGRPAAGQVKALVQDLRNACMIAIQAFVAMRISEVCGLQAYPIDEKTGLPACIKIETSQSGLYDVFYIVGHVFKTATVSESVTWVAGMRPHGTDALPPPIQAILILEELFRPWREASGRPDLVICFGPCTSGFPSKLNHITSIKTNFSIDEQKDWVNRYINLPYKWNLTTHQWRKSFALYTIRTDSRMLTAISQHFKHLSIAMTSEGYIGSDMDLLGIINDMAVRETSRILYDLVSGKVPVSGKMGDLLRERLPQIKSRFEGMSDEEKKAEIEALVSGSADLRVYSCDWGWCFFRSETSLCNPGEQQPSPVYRCPQTCCDCSNLAVTPEHRPYWSRRLEQNQCIVEDCKAKGLEHEAFVAIARAAQCTTVLRMMERLEV